MEISTQVRSKAQFSSSRGLPRMATASEYQGWTSALHQAASGTCGASSSETDAAATSCLFGLFGGQNRMDHAEQAARCCARTNEEPVRLHRARGRDFAGQEGYAGRGSDQHHLASIHGQGTRCKMLHLVPNLALHRSSSFRRDWSSALTTVVSTSSPISPASPWWRTTRPVRRSCSHPERALTRSHRRAPKVHRHSERPSSAQHTPRPPGILGRREHRRAGDC